MLKYNIASVAIIFIVILVALPVFSPSLQLSADATPTESPFQAQSLFDGDICEPPCWLGLTPGISTAEDVEVFVQQFGYRFVSFVELENNTYDLDTGYIIDGAISFFWDGQAEYERHGYNQWRSYVYIEQGIVSSLKIEMNRFVSLTDVLVKLGSPGYVVFRRPGSVFVVLKFGYPDLHLIVNFNLDTYSASCDTASPGADFWVSHVKFYASPDIPVIESKDNERLVPQEIWQPLLNNEMPIFCNAAWGELPWITVTPTTDPETH